MAYVKLPPHIILSAPRRVDEHHDAIDILVDRAIVHTVVYGTELIKGNSSEEHVIAKAHYTARGWLRQNGFLSPV